MQTQIERHYELLGVSKDANTEVIKKGAEKTLGRVKEAYTVLSNPEQRKIYDQLLDEELAKEVALEQQQTRQTALQQQRLKALEETARNTSTGYSKIHFVFASIVIAAVCFPSGFVIGRTAIPTTDGISLAERAPESASNNDSPVVLSVEEPTIRPLTEKLMDKPSLEQQQQLSSLQSDLETLSAYL